MQVESGAGAELVVLTNEETARTMFLSVDKLL